MQFAVKPGFLILACLIAAGCASDDPDPVIAYVNPGAGALTGNEVVTVGTQGFDDDFRVHPPEIIFGFQPALSVTAVSRSVVEVVTPPSLTEQIVDVTARSTGRKQTAFLAGGFAYVADRASGLTVVEVGDTPPFVRDDLISVTNVQLGGTADVVGLAGAILDEEASVEVTVTNLATGEVTTFDVQSGDGFSVSVFASTGDELLLEAFDSFIERVAQSV